MIRTPTALTYAQRRADLLGQDASEWLIATPDCATCQRGGIFSGNSKSSSSTANYDNRIGVESGMATTGGSTASQEGNAISNSNVLAEDSQQITSSNVADDGGTLFQNVSGGIVIGDPQAARDISATFADTIKDMNAQQADSLSNILSASGGIVQGVANLAESKLTDGDSTLSKNIMWIALAGIGLVAVLNIKSK